MHAWGCVYMEARELACMSSSRISALSLRQWLSLAWSSPVKLDQLTSKLQDPSVSAFLELLLTITGPHTALFPAFWCGVEGELLVVLIEAFTLWLTYLTGFIFSFHTFMKMAQYKQCKSSGVTGEIFREHYFCGFPDLWCWKVLETDIKATLDGSKLVSLSGFLKPGLPQPSHPIASWELVEFGFLPSHFSNSISSVAHRGSSRTAILGNWWGEDRQFSSDLASALSWGRTAQADVDTSLWWEDPGGELTEPQQQLIRNMFPWSP